MSNFTADVALLTDGRYTAAVAAPGDWYLDNILRDDHLLQSELADRGLRSTRLDWADPDVDWSTFRCAVFRTTWDYFQRLPEFIAWLERVRTATRLCNPYSTVKWNLDKHYLTELEVGGIPIVPSRFIEQRSTVILAELLDDTGWDQAVIKPCISGGAWNTHRFDRRSAVELQLTIDRLLTSESLIVQPFMRRVLEEGEDTLMLFDGSYSHAIRKLPKPGDFRVQDDHGGTVHDCQATDEQIELAERTFDVCQPTPAYGRVDLVRDNDGRLAVMELELIEPELWLRNHPPAASRFAEAIARFLAES